jgi:hypothetical protein
VQKCIRTIDIDIIGTTARTSPSSRCWATSPSATTSRRRRSPGPTSSSPRCSDRPRAPVVHGLRQRRRGRRDLDRRVGVPADRVQRRDGTTSGRWGCPGPCGPSSEIFWTGAERFGEDGGPIGGDEERFVEIWNLVFMQNIQDEPYHVIGDLPAKNIDTGGPRAGRHAAPGRGESVFETDLMRPVVAAAERPPGRFGEDGRDVSLRIMADHGRALTFLIADGVVPSNEGRGYVLRRLLRRAVRHAWQLGSHDLVIPAGGGHHDRHGGGVPGTGGQRDLASVDRRTGGGAVPRRSSPVTACSTPNSRPSNRGRRWRGRPPSSCTTPSGSRSSSPRRSSPSAATSSTAASSRR